MTTIGYGIPHDTDAFFSGCITLTLTLTLTPTPTLTPHDTDAFFLGVHIGDSSRSAVTVYGQPLTSIALIATRRPPNELGRCISLTLAVYGQSLTFIMLNAALLGIIFARVGRANARAAQIIFSDKAVIRCVRGKFYLNLQVTEAALLD